MLDLPASMSLAGKLLAAPGPEGDKPQNLPSLADLRQTRKVSIQITSQPQKGTAAVLKITPEKPKSRPNRNGMGEGLTRVTSPRKVKYLHGIPDSTISEDETTSTFTISNTITHAELRALILKQIVVPPKPLIRIRGVRGDRKWSTRTATVEFDFKINVASLLSKRLSRTVVHDHEDPTSSDEIQHFNSSAQSSQYLDKQIKTFLSDSSSYKMLIMRREVNNWDTKLLQSQLLPIVRAAAGYSEPKIGIDISFPVTYNKIVLRQKPSRPSLPQRMSSSASITASLADLTMKSRSRPTSATRTVSFTMTPTNLVAEHHITTSTWSYATAPPGSSERKCAVWSESDWLQQWRELICSAVQKRRTGWLGSDEYTEDTACPLNACQGWSRWWQ